MVYMFCANPGSALVEPTFLVVIEQDETKILQVHSIVKPHKEIKTFNQLVSKQKTTRIFMMTNK